MTLQKHKVDNMTESDAHMVMSWLTDAIESLEEEQEDIQNHIKKDLYLYIKRGMHI